jgi:hypothetical protein
VEPRTRIFDSIRRTNRRIERSIVAMTVPLIVVFCLLASMPL